ncbi:MAG: right-handed parallel beta-helix repeat-containing protein [Rikenellaceae bacterium]
MRTKLFLCAIAASLLTAWSCSDEEPTTTPSDGSDTEVEATVTQDSELFADLYDEENDEIKYSSATTYDIQIYVNSLEGDDGNDGTSAQNAILTLSRAQEMLDAAPDSSVEILLYGGDQGAQHNGMISIESRSAATHVGSYGGSKKARINAAGYAAAFYISQASDVVISDIKISADGGHREGDQRCGVYVYVNSEISNIEINNVDIRDVFYYGIDDLDIPASRPCREWSTSGETNYGWGIRFFTTSGSVDGVKLIDCNVRNVSHTGLKMTSNPDDGIKNVEIDGCYVENCGGPGSQFSKWKDGEMRNTTFMYSGARNDPRQWGRGSGLWLYYCDDVLLEKCHFEGSEGIADSCGVHIDIGNTNVVIQYCLSRDNAGGFCEILGWCYNCSYRYNISINDGWRNPNDSAQNALWEPGGDSDAGSTNGVLMTLNGTDGSDPWRGPYKTYIYNNTIVNTYSDGVDTRGYTNPFRFEIATSAEDVLIANNLIWIPQKMTVTWGSNSYSNGVCTDKTYNFRVSTSASTIVDKIPSELGVTIKNNLYALLKDNASPSIADSEAALPDPAGTTNSRYPNYQDEAPKGGDPGLTNPTGTEAEDMIPTNAAVINQGMVIEKISGDAIGLTLGLDVDVDYFGNPITSPIIGACVAQ